MSAANLGTALAVLRMVRGWNQEELSRASGIRSGTISDYERGKMIPGLNTLQRLLGALGYPLSAVDQTQAFIDSLRGVGPPMDPLEGSLGVPAELRREVDRVSAEAGRAVSRLTRLMFEVMISSTAGEGGSGLHPGE
jgi:transcriptional regulator with XRE-family HTH domain